MPRHILVLGSTSPTGIDFCRAALSDGHTLTVFVRNASKLPAEIANDVTTITGQLTDVAALEEAVQGGATTCVSFLGPTIGQSKKGQTPIADAYKILLPLLQKHNYSRNMFVSTASYRAPQDVFSFLYSLMIWSVYLFFNFAYIEINTMTPLITALPVAEMNWTVFRVPMLKDGPSGPVKAEFVGKGVGMSLDRKALADWLLKEMEEGKWIGKCPAVSNA
ncbi:NAD(P)-binding protein [Melanomma pulvis-pyrius CBS 109.77]|uniref:NAD(P)-binding protein n=1 Tax=Melanomma pulvis-pyrius CBS 109.77 TaxID=1314802 RepID=A0A6A6X435_9PLEO|nr:NAD(P)-binding protein [Melanomma pulvis-pyrius CBS 109.77]